MALQANVSLNYGSMSAGQNPPPMATITVYNPNASAVVVTGIQVSARPEASLLVNSMAMNQMVPPTGPGQTVSVPALSSITFGPLPVNVGSAASNNPFQMVNQTGNLFPLNPQGSQPTPTRFLIGATVYGSDGSINEAGQVGVLVSGAVSPPVGFQGGPLQFNAQNNIALGVAAGVL